MTARLYLVRHAMPRVEPALASHEWCLDETGRAAAAELARVMPSGSCLWSSSAEPKAHQTIESMAACRGQSQIHIDAGFGEVARPNVFVRNHRQLASQYVSGTRHRGWEDHDAVVSRFDSAVRASVRAAHGRDIVVATHGMAMTLWLSRYVDIGDPALFWRGLALPDVFAVCPPAVTVAQT
ncbi:MAG TPA: phosphoglycerate mutase family protein [Candidatus Stackebrandtia faecavium]|nr:phosphoglycerate mutase family protein [Candidatus Stackebrandtia faecavium]